MARKRQRMTKTSTKSVASAKRATKSPAKAAKSVSKKTAINPSSKRSTAPKATSKPKKSSPVATKRIVDAKKDVASGAISAVKFEGNKSFTPIAKAIAMAEKGQIAEAHVVTLKSGKKYLRTNPVKPTDKRVSTKAGKLEAMAK